jgi:Tol biopolymer transport system component/DNA-binding winged helix-turn-helix (wHTH) protein
VSKTHQHEDLYAFGPFCLNTAERTLCKDQQTISLTPKAFDTLVVLVRNSGRVVEKDELLKEVWPDTFVEEGILAVNVGAIRKALSEGENGRPYIETVPRRGYRFIGEVNKVQKAPEAEIGVSKPAPWKKTWMRRGTPAVGLLLLIVVSLVWYVFRPARSSSVEPSPQIVPLTSYPGAELSPTFSPDASQVAFSWNGEQQDNFDIYVKLVDRGDPLRLTSNAGPDTSPAWSPDGRHIAFLRQGSVFLISPLGGPERRLADVQAMHIDWTPDSKSLAVSSRGDGAGNYRLLSISIESGETHNLVSPPGKGYSLGDVSFAVSPDGLTLAFARFSSNTTTDLFLAPFATGEPRRLAEVSSVVWGIGWTPDGRELVYAAGQSASAATLWRRAIQAPFGANSSRIDGTEDGSVEPTIARHSHENAVRVAYERITLDTNIWEKAAAETNASPRRIIASTRLDADPQFSPDGRRIAFSSDRSGIRQIWVCDSDGSHPAQLTSFKSGYANAPRWSPDGQRIAFAAVIDKNRDIYVISPEGGAPRRLTAEPSEEGKPSWSRDGRWIYFYSTRTGSVEIWKLPTETGQPVQVTSGGGQECFESPDGKVLYYESGGQRGLCSIPTSQAAAQAGPIFLPSGRKGWWAVADKGIYFVEFDEKSAVPGRYGSSFVLSGWASGMSRVSQPIKFYDFATRRVRQVGTIDKEVVRILPGLSVTHDGSRIAWPQIDHAESDLMMIENFR